MIFFFIQINVMLHNAGRSQRARWEHTDIQVDRDLFDLNVFSIISLSRLVFFNFFFPFFMCFLANQFCNKNFLCIFVQVAHQIKITKKKIQNVISLQSSNLVLYCLLTRKWSPQKLLQYFECCYTQFTFSVSFVDSFYYILSQSFYFQMYHPSFFGQKFRNFCFNVKFSWKSWGPIFWNLHWFKACSPCKESHN